MVFHFLFFTLQFKVLFKMENKDALQTVKEIRNLMEQSSKFSSINGISVTIVGIYALIGAFIAYKLLGEIPTVDEYPHIFDELNLVLHLSVVALLVLVLSFVTVLLFAWRKAKRTNVSFFSNVTYRTLFNFLLPLFVGFFFCLALIYNGCLGLIASTMLLFYGLSLINASKYMHKSIFWLGIFELVLGMASAFLIGKGLLFWAVGFGILHIVYGCWFYIAVDRKKGAGK